MNDDEPRALQTPTAVGGIKKKLLITLGILVLLVGVAIGFLPQIGQAVFPWVVEVYVSEGIEGEVEVRSRSLSWGGPQKVELAIRETPSDAQPAAVLQGQINRGLFGLRWGGGDLGVITLTGEVNIVQASDGTTNLARALRPKAAPPPKNPRPASTTGSGRTGGSFKLDGRLGPITGTITTADARTFTIDALKGGVQIDSTAGTVDATLDLDIDGIETVRVDAAFTGMKRTGAASGGAMAGEIDIRAEVMPELLNAAVALAQQRVPDAIEAGIPASTLDGRFVLQDGRIKLGEGMPAELVVHVPRALAGESDALRHLGTPTVRARIGSLDVPIDAASDEWGSATGSASVELSPVEVTLENDGRKSVIALTPRPLELSVPRLDEGFSLTGRVDVAVDEEGIGEVVLDADAGALIDADGAFRYPPPDARARLDMPRMPSAVIEELAKTFGVEAPIVTVLGDSVLVDVSAGAVPCADGQVPDQRFGCLEAVLSVDATKLRANAKASADGEVIRLTEEAIVRLDQPDALLAELGGQDAEALGLTDDGNASMASVRIDSLRVPWTSDGAGVDLEQAEAALTANTQSMALIGPGGERLGRVGHLVVRASLSPGGGLEGNLHGAVEDRSGETGRLVGDFGAVNVLAGADLEALKPNASLTLDQLPIALGSAFDAESTQRLIESLGPHVTGQLKASAIDQGTSFELNLQTDRASVRGTTSAAMGTDAYTVELRPTDLQVILQPGVARAFVPVEDGKPAPDLAEPITLAITSPGTTVRFPEGDGGEAEFLRPLAISARFEGRAIVRNALAHPAGEGMLDVTFDDGASVELTLNDLAAQAGTIAAKAGLVDPASGRSAANLDASLDLPMESASINGTLTIADGDASALDAMLGTDFTAAALGESFEASILAATPAAGEGTRATLRVDSPRLKASGDVLYTPEAVRAETPIALDWTLTPAAADALLFRGGTSPLGTLAQEVRLNGQVAALSVGLGEGGLAPGELAVEAAFETTSIVFREAGGGAPIDLGSGEVSVALDETGTGLATTISLATEQARRATGGETLLIEGRVIDLFDERGQLTADRARFTGLARGQVETGVIDSIAGTASWLARSLGESVVADLSFDAFRPGLDGGSMTGRVASPALSLDANARGLAGGLVLEEGTAIAMHELRADMVVVLIKPIFPLPIEQFSLPGGQPLFSGAPLSLESQGTLLENAMEEAPAMISIQRLEVPLSGDRTKVNGRMTYALNDVALQLPQLGLNTPLGNFGDFLNTASFLEGVNADGVNELLREDLNLRMQPFDVVVANGVASPEGLHLRLGDFRVPASGQTNLVTGASAFGLSLPSQFAGEGFQNFVERLLGEGESLPIPLSISTANVFEGTSPQLALDPQFTADMQGRMATGLLDRVITGGGDNGSDTPEGGEGEDQETDPVEDIIRRGIRDILRPREQ